MIIIVSGSPGTGKTSVAKELAARLNLKYVDVNELVKQKGLSDGYDKERDCEIVGIQKLNYELIRMIKAEKNLVIDSHLSHYLPKEHVDFCIITKCDIKELEKRLTKRGYSKQKIRENLDAEIFDTCRVEALDAGHNVVEVETTNGFDIEELMGKVQ